MIDKYKTIKDSITEEIVKKKSRFICNLAPVNSEEEGLQFIQQIKKQHYNANHNCYAMIIGINNPLERCNDDGEPAGTAGKPMLEVLRGHELKNVVSVVTRYFGGTLLGTGGLIKAYTESVKAAVDNANIYEKKLCEKVSIVVDYSNHPKIEYLLHKSNQIIYEINYSDKVSITLLLDYKLSKSIQKNIIEITNGDCKISADGLYYTSYDSNKVYIEKLEI